MLEINYNNKKWLPSFTLALLSPQLNAMWPSIETKTKSGAFRNKLENISFGCVTVNVYKVMLKFRFRFRR